MLVAECPECRDFSRFTLQVVGYPTLPLPEGLEGSLGPSGLVWTCPHCGVVTAMENLVVTGGSEVPKEIDPDAYYVHSPLTLVALAGPFPTERDASVAIDMLLRAIPGSTLQRVYESVGSTKLSTYGKLSEEEARVESGHPAVPVLPSHSSRGLTVAAHRPVMDALEPSFPERPEQYPATPEPRSVPTSVRRAGRDASSGPPKVRKRAERLVGVVEGARVVEHGGETLGTVIQMEDRSLKGIWATVHWDDGETTTSSVSALVPAPGEESEVDYDQIDVGARMIGDEQIVAPDGDRADQALFLI